MKSYRAIKKLCKRYHLTLMNTIMKKIILFVVASLIFVSHYAQVNFSARIFTPKGKPIEVFLNPIVMIVESEDTARYMFDTTTIVHFENILIGSRCYFTCFDIAPNLLYYSDIFTLDSNMYVDSLVMQEQRRENGYDDFFTWKEKDSVVDQLQKDINGYDTIWYFFPDSTTKNYSLRDEVNCFRLARFYYKDWMNPFPSWRKWSNAADSAYKYSLYVYNNYPKFYYLYYPLKQLAKYLDIDFVEYPPKAPEGVKYISQPDMPNQWWKDTTLNLFQLWQDYEEENEHKAYFFERAEEASICCPLAEDGTIRLLRISPMDATYIWRIQNGYLYYKLLSCRDSHLIKEEKLLLSSSVLDSIGSFIRAFNSKTRSLEDEGLITSTDPNSYFLEYIVDGKYYYCTTTGDIVPKELEDVIEFIESLKGLF